MRFGSHITLCEFNENTGGLAQDDADLAATVRDSLNRNFQGDEEEVPENADCVFLAVLECRGRSSALSYLRYFADNCVQNLNGLDGLLPSNVIREIRDHDAMHFTAGEDVVDKILELIGDGYDWTEQVPERQPVAVTIGRPLPPEASREEDRQRPIEACDEAEHRRLC